MKVSNEVKQNQLRFEKKTATRWQTQEHNAPPLYTRRRMSQAFPARCSEV
jgi:hypothetical protein